VLDKNCFELKRVNSMEKVFPTSKTLKILKAPSTKTIPLRSPSYPQEPCPQPSRQFAQFAVKFSPAHQRTNPEPKVFMLHLEIRPKKKPRITQMHAN
jgi:hypothetical protein